MSLEQKILATQPVANEASANRFSELGVPNRKNEEYKFTDLKRIIEKNFSFQAFQNSNKNLLEESLSKLPLDQNDYKIVFVNGSYDAGISKIPEGISFEIVKEQQPSSLVKDLKSKSSHEFIEDSFSTLNGALAQTQGLIKVAKNVVVESPLHILYLSDASLSESYQYPALTIEHEENSQAQYIETTMTIGANASLYAGSMEIYLASNAVVDYYIYQNDSDHSLAIKNTKVYQDKHSNFSSYTFTIGGGVVRNNLNIALVNERIETNMFGLYMLRDNAHADNHTVVDHQYPNCLSNELYKGVLADKSKGVFNGKIFVREDAQQTNAFQSNNNIVISDQASVNTKPQLEIWADDVKCSHGCTVGQLNEDAIFYMRARGLDQDKARSLLLQAFAADVIEKVKIEKLRDFLIEKVNERLA